MIGLREALLGCEGLVGTPARVLAMIKMSHLHHVPRRDIQVVLNVEGDVFVSPGHYMVKATVNL